MDYFALVYLFCLEDVEVETVGVGVEPTKVLSFTD